MSYYDFESYWKEFLRYDDIVTKDIKNEKKYQYLAKKAFDEGKRQERKWQLDNKDVIEYERTK